MNEIEYFARWEVINKLFSNWFQFQTWSEQKIYLSKKKLLKNLKSD